MFQILILALAKLINSPLGLNSVIPGYHGLGTLAPKVIIKPGSGKGVGVFVAAAVLVGAGVLVRVGVSVSVTVGVFVTVAVGISVKVGVLAGIGGCSLTPQAVRDISIIMMNSFFSYPKPSSWQCS